MYLLSLISNFPIVVASGGSFKNTDWNPICNHSKVIYPRYYKHSNESYTFVIFGQIGPFLQVSDFLRVVFACFHAKNKHRIKVSAHCTLIRGAMVIQPGLKSTFFITPCCILTIFCLGVQSSSISDFNPMHNGEFSPLIQISTFPWLFSCHHASI